MAKVFKVPQPILLHMQLMQSWLLFFCQLPKTNYVYL
jgi:hypothetical protein